MPEGNLGYLEICHLLEKTTYYERDFFEIFENTKYKVTNKCKIAG